MESASHRSLGWRRQAPLGMARTRGDATHAVTLSSRRNGRLDGLRSGPPRTRMGHRNRSRMSTALGRSARRRRTSRRTVRRSRHQARPQSHARPQDLLSTTTTVGHRGRSLLLLPGASSDRRVGATRTRLPRRGRPSTASAQAGPQRQSPDKRHPYHPIGRKKFRWFDYYRGARGWRPIRAGYGNRLG
jgi:hypothetical protein